MRRFNPSITKVLEDVNLANVPIEPQSERVSHSEQLYIEQILRNFKEGKIDKVKAGKLLRRAATETKKNKPLAVVADFVDILNQSTKTGNVVSTSALRKLASTLGVKQGAFDALEEKDKALAIQLIHADYRQDFAKGPTPGRPG